MTSTGRSGDILASDSRSTFLARPGGWNIWAPFFLVVILMLASGCACPRAMNRSFELSKDSFAFGNELRWQYEFDRDNHVTIRQNEPPPQYSLRCFPMVRAAREFFYHAQFRPDLPKTSESKYRQLVHAVIRRSSRCPSEAANRIEIPGYANLHEFSAEQAALLKSQCGGVARSFFQRGNWRMVFPVTHSAERQTAERFVTKIKRGKLPIAHVYQFPNTTLNHAILLYAAEENEKQIAFAAYDPNNPAEPATLVFDRSTNRFVLGRTPYFAGGTVKVYEVYRGVFF